MVTTNEKEKNMGSLPKKRKGSVRLPKEYFRFTQEELEAMPIELPLGHMPEWRALRIGNIFYTVGLDSLLEKTEEGYMLVLFPAGDDPEQYKKR